MFPKPFLIVVITIVMLNTETLANSKKKYRELKYSLTSEIINIPAQSLWAIVSQFDKVHEWTSTLRHSTGVGTPDLKGAPCRERVCETNIRGFKKVVETLTMYNDEKMELAYELTEGRPGFIYLASNHWKVIDLGLGRSQIQMDITNRMSRFAGFLIGSKIKKIALKQVGIVMKELKVYAETGNVPAN